MFLIREVRENDIEDIFKLSEVLKLASKIYFLNLPHNKEILREKINLSMKSFAGQLKNPLEGEYIFVLEDLSEKGDRTSSSCVGMNIREQGKVIGTSMIVAQHGTRKSPHQFFRVKKVEKFSESLHIGFIHEVLEYGNDSDGPTEIGGLVLDPAYRNSEEHLGKQLSFVRFLYIAMKKKFFKKNILAELQPPLTSSGKSLLWEALGRKFTNLSYHKADQLSRQNKEFIISLFPEGSIYTCLLNTQARECIGKINTSTLPVEHMLKKIGFNYLEMVDPFDGGPHFGARVSEITTIQNTQNLIVKLGETKQLKQKGLVGSESSNGFIAVQSQFMIQEDVVLLPRSIADLLNHPKQVVVTPY